MENYIGIYDSGIGGLTVLRKLAQRFKSERFIYLGDNDYAPYGTKSTDEIFARAYACMNTLAAYKPKAVVIACNTISAVCGKELKGAYPFKIITMRPDIKSSGERVLITGTPNTLKRMPLSTLDPQKFTVLCLPSLAGDIEKNIFDLKKVCVEKYFDSVDKDYKKIVLGCTHYPYIASQIKKLFPGAKIADGIAPVASELAVFLNGVNRNAPTENSDEIIETQEDALNNIEDLSDDENTCEQVFFIGKNSEKNKQVFNMYKKR